LQKLRTVALGPLTNTIANVILLQLSVKFDIHGYVHQDIPYFSIDNAHLMYNARPKYFDIPFDV
jgi:hypothetical protein